MDDAIASILPSFAAIGALVTASFIWKVNLRWE